MSLAGFYGSLKLIFLNSDISSVQTMFSTTYAHFDLRLYTLVLREQIDFEQFTFRYN